MIRIRRVWSDTEIYHNGYRRGPTVHIRASGICDASFTITAGKLTGIRGDDCTSCTLFQADSGGPLMVGSRPHGNAMVVGVVSTGIGCSRPRLPGIYTKVSDYIIWITQVVQSSRWYLTDTESQTMKFSSLETTTF